VLGLAVPGFWLAILMVMLFAVRLGWLPSSGYVSPLEDPVQSLRYMLLPAIALGAGGAGSLTRQIRSSLLEVLRADYVRTARAKGLRGRIVLIRHALRNALIPAVTVLGLSLGHLLGGSLIVESIFLVPGVGSLLVNAIFTRDFPVVQAGTLVIAVMVVFINLGVDMLYGILDPRIG
jgi:peptide/nickel transport system permease protein